jgi:hypothetical protein
MNTKLDAFDLAIREEQRTRIWTDPKTGNQYTVWDGEDVPHHWGRKDPLHVRLFRTEKTKDPYVSLDSSLGCGAEYAPETLRALAATFLKLADDAEATPKRGRIAGPHRGYPVVLS